jgi:hypothetical protein
MRDAIGHDIPERIRMIALSRYPAWGEVFERMCTNPLRPGVSLLIAQRIKWIAMRPGNSPQ